MSQDLCVSSLPQRAKAFHEKALATCEIGLLTFSLSTYRKAPGEERAGAIVDYILYDPIYPCDLPESIRRLDGALRLYRAHEIVTFLLCVSVIW